MDGHAADAKRAYCNTKGSFGPLVPVKISLASPLHTKTYPRPVLHFRASAIPNEIDLTSIIRTSSAITTDSATPVFFRSSKSTLSFRRFCPLAAFPSGDAGRLGGPSTSARRCTYSVSRCACLHRPKPGVTCACFCSTSAQDHGRKGKVKLTSTASTLMTSNALPSPFHS